ncbi:MAG: MBL fold metallo-hydrolase [Clostridiaceae bacterium]|nr:MBL fold metallo-hydrolase [Clostridiaceae bacterium]
MDIMKIKTRHVLFRFQMPDWDLNLHLILGTRYNYLVDTGLGSLSVAPVREYLQNDRKPMIVVNTHYHWDHIWGNHVFSDCMIISHRQCRETAECQWAEMLERNKAYVYGDVRKCLPGLVFENTLYFPDDKIRLIYTPGHTSDSISVLDEQEGVLNAGDNIGDTVDKIIPSVQCDKEVYIDTLLKYQTLAFDTCISGHNAVLGNDVIDRILEQYV